VLLRGGLVLPLSAFVFCHGKVDVRPHGKENSRLPWCKAGQPSRLVDVVDSDQ